MKKIKTFGCIFLVIALVMVFSLIGVPEVASAYTPTEEDLEYNEWYMDIKRTLMMYNDLIMAALYDADYDDIELWGGKKYDFCKESLEEIEQFDVSPEMQPIKNEDKLALQDSKQASYYLERYAKYFDSDDAEMSSSYTKSSTEHTKKSNALLEELLSEITIPSPTTEETPTSVVKLTPSPTPQSEKDSDSDGVPDEYDYAPTDVNVQTKSDTSIPGFGAVFTISSLLSVAFGLKRRKCQA